MLIRNILKEIDQLEAMADQVKIKAIGLRKKLQHFNAGVSPKGRKISVSDELSVIQGLRNFTKKKAS